jgi:hypothetical protein
LRHIIFLNILCPGDVSDLGVTFGWNWNNNCGNKNVSLFHSKVIDFSELFTLSYCGNCTGAITWRWRQVQEMAKRFANRRTLTGLQAEGRLEHTLNKSKTGKAPSIWCLAISMSMSCLCTSFKLVTLFQG